MREKYARLVGCHRWKLCAKAYNPFVDFFPECVSFLFFSDHFVVGRTLNVNQIEVETTATEIGPSPEMRS